VSTVLALTTRALDTDFPSSRTADAGRFVREAIREIYRETSIARGDIDITANVATAGNVITFPAAGNAPFINSIMGDDGVELAQLGYDEVRSLQLANPAARGRPRVFAVSSTGVLAGESFTITLYPTADRAYAFTVTGRIAPQSSDMADGSTAPLPEDFERLPVYYARRELFALEDDERLHDLWDKKYQKDLRRLKGFLATRSNRPRIISGTWGRAGDAGPTFHRPGLF
jgi:hypothetical protein